MPDSDFLAALRALREGGVDGYLIVYQYAKPDVVTILHIVARGRDLFALYLQ